MSVFRIHHTTEYTVISNKTIRDNNLSLKTLGLLVKMLSLPPNWDFCIQGLAKICKDGEASITSGLKELEENGYLKRTRIYANGKVADIEYDLYECADENLKQENLKLENLKQENQDNKINNNINNNDNNKTDVELTDDEYFEKYRNRKDPKTLMTWTNMKVRNQQSADALIEWIKLMIANNKWQTLEAYDKKLATLYNLKGDLAIPDIVNDAMEKGYFSFKYSIDYLNRQKTSKPSYQFKKEEPKSDKKFGVDNKVDANFDEVF